MSKNKRMFIVGDNTSYYGPFAPFYDLIKSEQYVLKNPNEVDLILFTGGADVDPLLYQDVSPHYASTNWNRDQEEAMMVDFAIRNEIKMCGICRGMQLLNVMDGGKLLHHVSGHADQHKMLTYRGTVEVNSLHHQACIPSKNSLLIGWSNITGVEKYYGNFDKQLKNWPNLITEALLFPKINAYGVQFHPELMPPNSAGYNLFLDLVEEISNERVDSKKILEKWTHHYRIIWDEAKDKNCAFYKKA